MTNKNVSIIFGNIQASISISNFLEFQGFRTFESYNCKDGEISIRTRDPFCVILENAFGEEAKKIIKMFPKKPFILLSHSEEDYFHSKNVIGKVIKPVENQEILALLNKAFKF